MIEIVRRNADPTLDNLRETLLVVLPRLGRVATWQEWHADDPWLPEHISRTSKMCLYVDGHLVPLPLVIAEDAIEAAIVKPLPASSRGWRLARALGRAAPALVLAALPKCPVCFAVYLGSLSLLTATRWAAPLAYAFAAVTTLFVLVGARRTKSYGPAAAWVLGVALIAAGRSVSGVGVVGGLMLVTSALWHGWSRDPRSRKPTALLARSLHSKERFS